MMMRGGAEPKSKELKRLMFYGAGPKMAGFVGADARKMGGGGGPHDPVSQFSPHDTLVCLYACMLFQILSSK